ncbi:MAG: L-seryl-tRNA(Sec) selenium transferase [bacterium]
MRETTKTSSARRAIPSVDRVLNTPEVKGMLEHAPRWLVVSMIREILEAMRAQAGIASGPPDQAHAMARVVDLLTERVDTLRIPHLRKVINGTGIIIHTNLGRAPLPEGAISLIMEIVEGYSNLEYDLAEGRRGKRTAHVRDLILRLTGAREAYVVNNNAGAVLLALNSLAESREVIVSRGELVEIGGSFRIPDVMRKSGAIMREVGTTNRTHPSDYEKALSERTGLLLKVHTSNYRITGFSAEVSLEDLVALGRRHAVPVMMDLGSGNLTDLAPFGLKGEPTIQQVLSTGVDVITFSGDKLLGGPQAGIILTQGAVSMESMSGNPLARALRIDKLTLAGLEAVLLLYLTTDHAASIPVLQMISCSAEQVRVRAEACLRALEGINAGMMSLRIQEDVSSVGGGALPGESLPTFAIGFRPGALTVESLDEAFRRSSPAVVGRIQEGTYKLDLRTIGDEEIPMLVNVYEGIVKDAAGNRGAAGDCGQCGGAGEVSGR